MRSLGFNFRLHLAVYTAHHFCIIMYACINGVVAFMGNIYPLEVVDRGSETQLQVVEK